MSRRPFEAPTKVRFATYCLLSLASVAVSHFALVNSKCAIQLLWLTGPCIVAIRFAAYMDSNLHPSYTAPICAVLVFLRQLAIWTQTYLTIPPTDIRSESSTTIQACVIHFAMSFYVLSECEYYRLYWIMHLNNQPLTFHSLFKAYFAADIDRAFEQSRDCLSYHFGLIDSELPLRDGWVFRNPLTSFVIEMLIFYYPFMFSWMCLSYLVKRLANPDLEDEGLQLVFSLRSALFTPTNKFSLVPNSLSLMLGVKLQRPIRLLNRMLFWLIVDFAKYVRKWRKQREPTLLP
jgi:hypothetical protein